MNIVKVDDSNKHVYMNLAQAYGAEFSRIIGQRPDKNGLFPVDPQIEGNVSGYLLYIDGIPAALTAIATKSPGRYEICDFYVVPYFRKNKVGKHFISDIWNILGGSWEIKEVAGADHAVKFWRDVLGDYTSGDFIEDSYDDEKWGVVTRQRFTCAFNAT